MSGQESMSRPGKYVATKQYVATSVATKQAITTSVATRKLCHDQKSFVATRNAEKLKKKAKN